MMPSSEVALDAADDRDVSCRARVGSSVARIGCKAKTRIVDTAPKLGGGARIPEAYCLIDT